MEQEFHLRIDCLSALLDNIPDNLCVIDETGKIVYVNQQWRTFADDNGATEPFSWLGSNYLENCRSAADQGDGYAHVAYSGISDVIAARKGEFSFEYPCHSPDEKRWFRMSVRGFSVSDHPYYMISHYNITERRSAEEALIAQARMDGLTNIANRRYLDQFLMMEWRRCARLRLELSVILIDIDFFKQYNDTLGHLEGDYCLKQVASALNHLARRPSDLCARYGGEEFALVMGNSDYDHALIMAERALNAVRELKLPHPDSAISDYVTISVGIASVKPSGAYEKAQLLENADQMLYKAKSSGRNCAAG